MEKYLTHDAPAGEQKRKSIILSKNENIVLVGIESLDRLNYNAQDELKAQAMEWVRSLESNKGKEVYFVMLNDIHTKNYIA